VETLVMIRQTFEEESLNCIQKIQTHGDRVRKVKSKVKSMLIDIKGIVEK
jgi:hypothetical protein